MNLADQAEHLPEDWKQFTDEDIALASEVVDAYLEEHFPDEDLPVTAEWLIDNGFVGNHVEGYKTSGTNVYLAEHLGVYEFRIRDNAIGIPSDVGDVVRFYKSIGIDING